MSSTDPIAGEPKPHPKDYVEITQFETEVDKKFIEDPGLPAKIIYLCRDCNKVIKPKRIGKKFKFSCTECKGNNVSFGTEESVANYYKEAKK